MHNSVQFIRRHHEEQFCEIILNLGQWLRRCHLKDSYLELWRPLCSVERNHLSNFGSIVCSGAILKESRLKSRVCVNMWCELPETLR